LVDHRTESRPRNLYVPLRGAAGLFLEGVQYVNAFREPGDEDDAIFAMRVNADFLDAEPDRGHRLPVVRIEPVLHARKLAAGALTGLIREFPHGFSAVAQPGNRLHAVLYSF